MMRNFLQSLLVVVCLLAATVSWAFQPSRPARTPSATALDGLFDGFINSMEAGYKGEDSAFKKQKAFDEEQRAKKKAEFEERRAKGFTLLSDVSPGNKTFVKPKYEYEEKPKEDKLWGIF